MSYLKLAIVGLAVLFSTIITGLAEGVKPPSTGELYSYEGTLNLSELHPDADVTTGITDFNGSKMIKVDIAAIKGYPGVSFPIPNGGWDLTGYSGVQIEVRNPGTETVVVSGPGGLAVSRGGGC